MASSMSSLGSGIMMDAASQDRNGMSRQPGSASSRYCSHLQHCNAHH